MKVLIVPNFDKRNAHSCTRQVCGELISCGAEVLMEKEAQSSLNLPPVHYGEAERQLAECDLVIAIGGDGTIIHVAKQAVKKGKPVLGINAGRLGFLAGLEQNELPELKNLAAGNYRVEERMMLEVIHRSKDGEHHYQALNDAVISKGALSRVVDLDIFCGDRFVLSYRADGIILATPTGSTAYALSAGGPIMEPSLDSISLTPISPHSLFDRTILFSAENELTIRPAAESEGEAYLTVDGETSIGVEDCDEIIVKKSDVFVRMIHLQDRPFYEVLNQKFLMRAKS